MGEWEENIRRELTKGTIAQARAGAGGLEPWRVPKDPSIGGLVDVPRIVHEPKLEDFGLAKREVEQIKCDYLARRHEESEQSSLLSWISTLLAICIAVGVAVIFAIDVWKAGRPVGEIISGFAVVFLASGFCSKPICWFFANQAVLSPIGFIVTVILAALVVVLTVLAPLGAGRTTFQIVATAILFGLIAAFCSSVSVAIVAAKLETQVAAKLETQSDASSGDREMSPMERLQAYEESLGHFSYWKERNAREFWLNLTGLEFEHELARVLRLNGFEAEVTRGSGDEGIDIILRKSGETIGVQCKNHHRPVGQPALRDFLGALVHMNADMGIFVASSGVTTPAKSFAKGKNIELWDLDYVLTLLSGDEPN
ncbi:MAG: hypothetical protein ACI9R3_004925 [Verrucomicrobiales bacterium]|jgi:hypothetical protein